MSKAFHDEGKQAIEARGEPAIDELAIRLGMPTLAQLAPDRVHEWRTAFAARQSRLGRGGY